jgi:hypothetical protein
LQDYLTQLPSDGDDPLLNPVSLFGTMDYGRLEIAHTRTLAWLLGDREHGFGHQLLEALLRHLLNPKGDRIHVIRLGKMESEWVTSSRRPADKGRLDVIGEGRCAEEPGEEFDWQLIVEAKIDAEEGEDQLSLYEESLEADSEAQEVIRIFLTPDGRQPQTGSADWRAVSYLELASVFRRVLPDLKDKPGYHYLRYYLTGVLKDICGLPSDISASCANPYVAVEYLHSLFKPSEQEENNGDTG